MLKRSHALVCYLTAGRSLEGVWSWNVSLSLREVLSASISNKRRFPFLFVSKKFIRKEPFKSLNKIRVKTLN